jgi:hypothetical protein
VIVRDAERTGVHGVAIFTIFTLFGDSARDDRRKAVGGG